MTVFRPSPSAGACLLSHRVDLEGAIVADSRMVAVTTITIVAKGCQVVMDAQPRIWLLEAAGRMVVEQAV